MIVGAHQPHFLPWLGYFHKIAESDVFVLVDHVQFERQNFQNRNRIKARSGVQWVVVPVHRARFEPLDRKEIDNKRDGRTTWGERIFRTLHHAYCKAPYYREHRDFFADTLTRPWARLVDLDEALIRYFLAQLDIHTRVVRSSELAFEDGPKSSMILGFCRALGADTYLSGSGGSARYLDTQLLESHGIRVAWQQFDHPRYAQRSPPHEFVPKLSAIDLLMNCGPASAAILRGDTRAIRECA